MKTNSLFRVYKDLGTIKKHMLPVLVCGVLVRSLRPFVYIVVPAQIIDMLMEGRGIKAVAALAAAAALLQGLLSLATYWLDNLNYENADVAAMTEKNRVTERLLRADFSRLADNAFAKKVAQHKDEASREGGIYRKCITVLETNCSALCSFVLTIVMLGAFWPVMFTRVGPLFLQSSWLGLAVLACTALVAYAMGALSVRVNRRNVRLRDEYAEIDHVFAYYRNMITDYKTGKEIRLFQQQDLIMRHATQEMIARGIPLQAKIARGDALAGGLTAVTFTVLTFGIYLLVGVKAHAGLFSVGDMMIYIGGLMQVMNACREMTIVYGGLARLKPRVERYYDILETPVQAQQWGSIVPEERAHTIECTNVGFAYDDGRAFALRGVNFSLRPGEKIAIVGENGSGKSTFIKLLCGLYDVKEGEILLDGLPIHQYDERVYRALFSVVLQDFTIFSLPLGENLSTSRHTDEDRANAALRQVGFPAKYGLGTMMYKDCSQDGIELSGGEAQKLALARALYRNTPFILLDEPTASLDPYAEYKLYQQFGQMVSDKSSIFISHRLSSCRFCDKVAVFEHGCLTQFGTHEELLMNKEGKYHQLWSAQAKYYAAEGTIA